MYKSYECIVGLEIHAELSTRTKAFCSCLNSFGGEVNTNCCPICMALPGSMPRLNEKVVDYAVRAGNALNCNINKTIKMDRKHYFYPDLPKAYQISQYDIPICENGYVEFLYNDKIRKIGITRIQMEEDAGKLIHDPSFDFSLVDFNRSGVPLIEIISEPDIRSSEEAKLYLENIRRILMDIDVCDGKMSEGSIRCDINVSVRKKGDTKFGTRVEMKNVNSFSAAQRAIEYEFKRQVDVIESGDIVFQETRRWDDEKNKNFVLRTKEDKSDYKFFKEPDLLYINVSDDIIEKNQVKKEDLSNYKFIKFVKEYNLSVNESNQLINSVEKTQFFEELIKIYNNPKNASNWILGDISRICNEKECSIKDTKITIQKMSYLLNLIDENKISHSSGKEIFEKICFEDLDIDKIIKDNNLIQISDNSFLEDIAKRVIENNQKAVEDYKNGKTNILGFLVGQCMKESDSKGNPSILKDILLDLIK